MVPDAFHSNIHGAFAAQAAARPAAAALEGQHGAISYGELDAWANRVATAIQERGGTSSDTVVVALPRSAGYAAATLGVLELGAACLPVSPDEPATRLSSIVAAASARFLITDAAGSEHFWPLGLEVLDVACTRHGPAASGQCVDAAGSSPAFIFSTSGSTGTPKLVVLSHTACLVGATWASDALGLSPADRHLFKTSVNFVSVLRQLIWPLVTGGAVVVVPPGDERDLGAMARLMDEAGVTIATFIPSAMRMVLEQATPGSCASLRHVLCGGELLSPRLQELFFSHWQSRLHNLYALTEVPLATHFECSPGATRAAPIGDPISPIVARVVTDSETLADVGEVGELCLGGTGVASGYLGQPEVNTLRFIPDPWSDSPGVTVFRTGDLVRRSEMGPLEFVGRQDDLVKVRGFRIELGEIESALASHPGVRQAVVLVHDLNANGEQSRKLVAYVVNHDEGPTAGDLRAYLGDRLPRYMLPHFIVFLSKLPLQETGKFDRAALRAMAERSPGTVRGETVPPRTTFEKAICGIWEDVLGIGGVGIRDEFVALGGDSLAAVEIALRVEELVGMELSFEVFARAGTVEELSSACLRAIAGTEAAEQWS